MIYFLFFLVFASNKVLETCVSLRKNDFISIRMVEVRRRPFDAKFMQIESPDVGRNEANHSDIELYNDSCHKDKTEIPGILLSS